jgi:hypothetical protein
MTLNVVTTMNLGLENECQVQFSVLQQEPVKPHSLHEMEVAALFKCWWQTANAR